MPVRFRLLQRELLREMSLVAGICLGAFLSLILLGRFLQLRELFLGQGVGFFDLAKLFVYLSPFFLLMLVPAACMLGLFLTLLRMGADRELISLRAGGLSVWRLLPAPLVLCLAGTAVSLWVSLYGISWGMDHFRQAVVEMARSKTVINVQPGVFNTSFPNLTFYATQADPVSGDLEDVFVRDASRPDLAATIVAPRGRILSNAEAGQIYVLLQDGHVYRQEKDGFSVVSFGEYALSLDMSRILGGMKIESKAPKEMSWAELNRVVASPEARADVDKYRRALIERHKRFALPVACLVLGLFSMPLALFFQGLNRQYGLVVSLGAFFVYYVLLTAGMSLAKSGYLPPAVALWAPNGLFFLLGSLGLWIVATERELDFSVFSRLGHALAGWKATS
ncbi:MAG: LPS export ABC transporter permease LptF [Deltaproteobacteria bacterium]|nr:LPS export ABC transporter permease LptF [Deltaproteobacteria bacterium]